MHVPPLLVDGVRPGFRFRPDPVGGQTPIHGARSLTGGEPDALLGPRRPVLQQRTHLAPRPARAGQDPFGIARKNPRIVPVPASLADHLGVVSGVPQHDHLCRFGKRQFPDQLRGRFGRGVMRQVLPLTVLSGVIRTRERDAHSRGGDQQAHREAVTGLGARLLRVVSPPFPGTPLAVAGAVGVLGLASLLAAQRGVENKDPQTLQRLVLQQGPSQFAIDLDFAKARSLQHAAHLGPMPCVAAHAAGRLQTGHPPRMQHKRGHHPDDHRLRRLPQLDRTQIPLESRNRIVDHDHGEACSSTGENPMIRSL